MTAPSPKTRPPRTDLPTALVLGPHLDAVSGVSTHLRILLGSGLHDRFALVHFQVGSEGRSEGRFGRLGRLAASPFALGAAIRRHGATLVHLNTSLDPRAFWRDLAYAIVAKLLGARVVYQIHGGLLPERFFGRSRALTALLRGALALPDAIVVLARSELAAYRRFVPAQRVVLIPNAIDCAHHAGTRLNGSGPNEPLRLVYLGRLARAKGLHELLQGLAAVRLQGVRAHLTIAGSGPDEAALRETAAALELDNVTITGPVFGFDKARLLEHADVFVLPSYGEGLPYALLEAMAAGAAVIVTRVGAVPDVVDEGVHGRFVPTRDPVAISTAIASLAADRGMLLRMSTACRRRIETAYSTERLTADFGGLYASLCRPSGAVGQEHDWTGG